MSLTGKSSYLCIACETDFPVFLYFQANPSKIKGQTMSNKDD